MGLGIRQKWQTIKTRFTFEREFSRYKKTLRSNDYKSNIVEPKATAIILSYARPQNIQWIALALLKCDFIEKVIISNNNPEMKINSWIKIDDPRLEIQNQPVRRRAGYRYEIAKDLDSPYYIFIDDDLYLSCEQIEQMYAELLKNPDVAHGLWGQTIEVSESGALSITNGVHSINEPIDVINRAYFLARHHVDRFLEILKIIGINEVTNLKFGDDMILSMSSKNKPQCHNIGHILECYTANMEGIAIWTEQSFDNIRGDLYKKLSAIPGSPKK